MAYETTVKRRKDAMDALSDEAYRLSPGLASDDRFLDRYSLIRVLNFLADHHPDVLDEIMAACAATANDEADQS